MSRDKLILPQDGKRNVLITSALPYVNNVPHLGNIIGCVLSADVYARYCRARGYNTLYVCGTDEYGTATEIKALKEGVSAREICDKFHRLHAEIYQWFNVGFDHFGRTSTESQTRIAQDIYRRVRERGATLERTVPQLYCGSCDRFLSDRFVEGECPQCHYPDARGDQCDRCQKLLTPAELLRPRCAVARALAPGRAPEQCGATPVERDSEHVYLDLPKLADRLEHWVRHTHASGGLWTSNTVRVTDAWLRDGLLPRAITRDLRWGTAVPEEKYKDKVFYVWFDAPIGYISITAEYAPDGWQRWWKSGSNNPESEQYKKAAAAAAAEAKVGQDSAAAPSGVPPFSYVPVELVQFMGKDNIPFHTVVFPATLLAADDNYTMVRTVSTTEYLNYEDTKFSKSLGVGVFGDQARDTGVPPAVWRYYLLAVRPESADSSFSWSDFQSRCNSELLANFGNYCNRVLKFTGANFGGAVPGYSPALHAALKAQFEAATAAGPPAAVVPAAGDPLLAVYTEFVASVSAASADYVVAMERQQLREGLQLAMGASKLANGFLQATKPWDLVASMAKTDDEAERQALRARCSDALALGLQVAYHCASLLEPFVPSLCSEVRRQLGFAERTNALTEPIAVVTVVDPFRVPAGQLLGRVEPLVRKLSNAEVDAFRAKFGGQQDALADGAGLPLFPLDLRLGRIDSVAPHPHEEAAERQYVLQVTLGPNEQRQLVSGVRLSYPDAQNQLVGRFVVVVCNLKPSKFKGVASNGMVLAADAGEGLGHGLCGLPDDAPAEARQPGARVQPAGTSFDLKKAPAKFNVKKNWGALGLVTGPDNIASVSSAAVHAAASAATAGKKGNKQAATTAESQPAATTTTTTTTASGSSSSSAGAGPITPNSSDFSFLEVRIAGKPVCNVMVDSSRCAPGHAIK